MLGMIMKLSSTLHNYMLDEWMYEASGFQILYNKALLSHWSLNEKDAWKHIAQEMNYDFSCTCEVATWENNRSTGAKYINYTLKAKHAYSYSYRLLRGEETASHWGHNVVVCWHKPDFYFPIFSLAFQRGRKSLQRNDLILWFFHKWADLA